MKSEREPGMGRLSVIIPALNEEQRVAQAVGSAIAAGAAEVIVVDGGSRDATCARATEAGARVIASNPGRGTQLNAGASRASGETLLFLHADNAIAAAAGVQIDEALHNPAVVAGCFRQRIDASAWRYRLVEGGNAFRARWLRLPYGDQGIFVRRSIFKQVGGFPDEPLMEDVALMRRCRRLGRVCLLPGPVTISARRWQEHGLIRQTVRNWCLLTAYSAGVSPRTLVRWYRPPRG